MSPQIKSCDFGLYRCFKVSSFFINWLKCPVGAPYRLNIISLDEVRFVAFLATDYDELLSGYQPGQMVERWV
jgi:hypothetical protein